MAESETKLLIYVFGCAGIILVFFLSFFLFLFPFLFRKEDRIATMTMTMRIQYSSQVFSVSVESSRFEESSSIIGKQ